MKISGTGFLSDEGKEEARRIQSELSSVLKIAYAAVTQCHKTLVSVQPLITSQITQKDDQKILASVLKVRLLEIAESVIYLAQGGFSVEIWAAYRNFLEAYFIFGNICSDASFAEKYSNSDLAVRQKLINVSIQSNSEVFESVRQYATDQIKKELKFEIESLAVKEKKTYEYAHNIGCETLYNSQYRIASAATHSTPRSLTDYIVKDKNKEIIELKRHPQDEGIEQRLLDLAWLLTTVNSAYSQLFSIPTNEEHKNLIDELNSFE
jgi:hypothetical protein